MLCFVFLGLPLVVHSSPPTSGKSTVQNSSLKALERRLRGNKFPEPFIKNLLRYYDGAKRDQVVRLNVMGFLLTADYSGHLSALGIERCREYLIKYKDVFALAEKKYGVKKETIVALLWVESRLGENAGGFHVASVYLSLLQSEHPEVEKMLLEDLKVRRPNPDKALIAKTKERAKIKGRWAIGELWALYEMTKKQPDLVRDLKGSYSGAFGIPQFLPSSYRQWAQSSHSQNRADLYEPKDAILSVAHYLHANGYRKGKPKTYKEALFNYNRSHDYVDIILKIASKL